LDNLNRKFLISSVIIIPILITVSGLYYWDNNDEKREHIIVSTTTSLYETGVLDEIKTKFESLYPNINVSFISQGTGLAIQTSIRGDANMILVHDPIREITFLQDRYGVNRKIIAYNFFVIVGPPEDPINLEGLQPLEALKKIRDMGEKGNIFWVSRGDDSGTHGKEKRLWKEAGFEIEDFEQEEWYVEAGSGMTATLRLTSEKSAYTLSDIGTFLKVQATGILDLEILVETGKETINVYSAIINNPEKTEIGVRKFDSSMEFISFLVSGEGQKIFNNFGTDEFNTPLFYPYVGLDSRTSNSTLFEWIKEYAFFEGSECPEQYRLESRDLYKNV
jgi:tungstate transport system substrate-binding protein